MIKSKVAEKKEIFDGRVMENFSKLIDNLKLDRKSRERLDGVKKFSDWIFKECLYEISII